MLRFHMPRNRLRINAPKKVWIPSSVVLIVIVIPVLILGIAGFVPGLSNLMGSTSQRNLGVNFSQQDLTSFTQKTPLTFKDSSLAPVNPATSTKQLLTQPVGVQNVQVSDQDVTAMLNAYHWSWMPLDNVQVRFTYGTVEVSGLLDSNHLDAFEQYISNGQPVNQNVARTINWSKHFRNHVPVYLKAETFAVDNFVSFKLEQVQVGRFDIPLSMISPSLTQVSSTDITASDLQVQRAQLTDGELTFTGTYPSVIYVKN